MFQVIFFYLLCVTLKRFLEVGVEYVLHWCVLTICIGVYVVRIPSI
jgi:hypothetical protein